MSTLWSTKSSGYVRAKLGGLVVALFRSVTKL